MEHKNHDKHEGHSTVMFLKKFWVSLIITIPVILYSDIVQKTFKWFLPAPKIFGIELGITISFILSSIVFFYGGWVFLVGAYRELKKRLPGMMTLIGIAISAAYLYSVYAVFGAPEHALFWELTSLITIMLLGHWLEMRAVSGAQGALKELSKLLPDTAEIMIQNGSDKSKNEIKIIPLEELKENDIVFVRPGGRIPSDGIVIEGKSEVNESMVTGESAPVGKKEGNEVIAGTINGDGSLKIKVTKVGEHTFLAGIMRLVQEAQTSKSRLQILSDRAAFYLTIIAIGAGGLTFILWILARPLTGGGLEFALERLVAVLVIACPHALGLAVPLVASISTTLAARHGFLIKQRIALETARKINIVLFDKTGTLTRGEYGITEIIQNEKLKIDKNKILQLAASVDIYSEHFISKAIVNEAKKRGVEIIGAENFERIPGKGVKGTINGNTIFVGGQAILNNLRVALPEQMEKESEKEEKKGKTIIYVTDEKEILGVLSLNDLIRDESKQAVYDLEKMGIKVAMITGDSEGVAAWVSKEIGIDEYFAKVLPHEKSEKVKILQRKGLKVAMIGDGINDAPALTQADLGIAIGAGTNIAVESAGIILVRNDPRDIVKIIKLSQATYSKMIQNIFWATGYNIIALPLAAGILASKNIILQPALAALFMSLSTVIVAINAMLLRKKIL